MLKKQKVSQSTLRKIMSYEKKQLQEKIIHTICDVIMYGVCCTSDTASLGSSTSNLESAYWYDIYRDLDLGPIYISTVSPWAYTCLHHAKALN